jgi:integrase
MTKEAGLEGLGFHSLRHTAAALMIRQGANALEVQRRLGHKDIRTTVTSTGTYSGAPNTT